MYDVVGRAIMRVLEVFPFVLEELLLATAEENDCMKQFIEI
jgi:hypothetical protein